MNNKIVRISALILISIIAALHFYIAWFEVFSWTTRGPKIFTDFPSELFGQTIQMAANHGLVWSLFIKERKWHINIASCFLLFVVAAGIFGAFTVTVKTLFIQTVPASMALILLWLSRH